MDEMTVITAQTRMFVVRRTSDGYTIVNQIEENKNKSIPLSEAWLKGYIGGLPNNF